MKKYSKIDIIFLIIFFIFLIVPISKMNFCVDSSFENRYLATRPLVFKNKKINLDFGKDFDAWFNDRFTFREKLIKVGSSINFYSAGNFALKKNDIENITLTHEQEKQIKKVLLEKDGVIDKKQKMLYIYIEFVKLEKYQLERAFKALSKFNDFLLSNNAKLYILVVPKKISIYPTKIREVKEDYYDEIMEGAKKYNLKLIYPLEELKKESLNNWIFFRTEHHWTHDGAFVAYQMMADMIKKDFPQIKELKYFDFDYTYSKQVNADFKDFWGRGQSCDYFGLSNHICKMFLIDKYRYFKHKDYSSLKTTTIDTNSERSKVFYYPNGPELNAILFGTSMNENLTQFMPFAVKNTLRIRTNGIKERKYSEEFKVIKYYKDKILNFQPDIFVFCVTINDLKEIYKIFME